jgi:hypothetical protein
VQRIDRPGGGGPGGADDQEREGTPVAVGYDRSGELLDVHPEAAVHRDMPHRFAADTRLVGDLDERVMRLGGDVDHGGSGKCMHATLSEVREGASQGGGDGGLVGLLPAGREVREAGLGIQTEHGHEPSEDVPFDLVGDRRMRPCGELGVVEPDQGVREDAGPPRAGIEQAEVAWVGDMQRPTPEEADDVLQQSVEGDRSGEVVPRQTVADLGRRHCRGDGKVAHRPLEVDDLVR